MSKIISVANQKGGVAKTATCRYLADIYIAQGKKVLLIDFDPQASLTKGFNINPELFEGVNSGNICNIFQKEKVSFISVGEEDEILHILPSNRELGIIGQSNIIGKDLILRRFITTNRLDKAYDIIIIDNNPKFDTMTINTILASNIIVIPVVTAKDEQEGLHGFFRNMEETLSAFNHVIDRVVIVPSRYNKSTKVGKAYLEIIKNDTTPFINKECPVVAKSDIKISDAVPEKVAFSDASSYNMSVYKYLVDHGSSSSMKKDKRDKLLKLLKDIAKKIIE
ncbi:Chromosome (plasmid) partitioning protein ParA / Sporulation initiation inhibitor protein Soj [hydrothermal vent metagenome]|uniref:Chromosome (Plasmid) partitioning protein ParA / Sporulation initiation inhibitor protein Soj n=1 Tax=hydrothermal vent metagenome TaxID=652676 RepID=A0A1W1CQJ3_9ZZZZ